MAESSTIGANFSQYTGDPNLGGGSLGAFQLDVRPLQEFARYTMLYNREEQARKQREAEKAAEELGKIADYDLTTSIQKDAKVLQEKYDKLISYVKQNPGALQFKNRDQWIEYQRLKNELGNDIRGARVRNVMNMAREKQIADEKDENVKKFMRGELDKEIAAKDIRTPIFYTQEYDMTIPDFSKNKGQSLVVSKWLDNQIAQNDFEIWDPAEARRNGIAVSMGVDFDETTTSGQLKQQKFDANFYVKGAEVLKQAIDNAKAGIDPSLDEGKKRELLRSKLSGIGIFKGVEALNNYLTEKQQEIKAGVYRDRFGNKLNPDDYAPINWEDGLSPEELNMVADYLGWAGDKQGTKIIQTNDAIERARIALGYDNLDLERQRMSAGQSEDLISADAVVREVQDAIKMAAPIATISPDGTRKEIKRISDPNLLKEFGNIDKDGNVTNVPDQVNFDPAANQLSLVYFAKDYSGKIKRTKKGEPEYERQVGLNPTQWIGQITKRKNPNKDIGGVNAIVEQIYTRYGRNLTELANNYGGQNATGTTTKTQSSSSSSSTSTPAKGDEKLTDAEYYMKYKKAKPKN